MPVTHPTKPVAGPARAQTFGPQLLFGIAVAAAFAVLAGAAGALPGGLAAPAAATLLLATAAAAAFAGWLRGNRADAARLTYWDVAGALTLVGIGAAALVEPEELARLFDAPSRQD
jgi:hypothetical protein